MTHMGAWAQRGSPEWAVWEDAVQLDGWTVGSGSRTCFVRLVPRGPSATRITERGRGEVISGSSSLTTILESGGGRGHLMTPPPRI